MTAYLSYPASLIPQKKGGYVVRFSDVPEAISQGESIANSLQEAAACLAEAIANRIAMKLDLPMPSHLQKGQHLIELPAPMVAKATLYLIYHALADIQIKPHSAIDTNALKQLIFSALDSCTDGTVSAEIVHQEARARHGKNYQTIGYFLKIYRFRKSLTQKKLAELVGIKQHHLSEMENNKRALGKTLAKKIATILDIDYRKLL